MIIVYVEGRKCAVHCVVSYRERVTLPFFISDLRFVLIK